MVNENFKTTIIPEILDRTCEEFKVKWGFVRELGLDERPDTVRIHFNNPEKHTHLSHLFDLTALYKGEDFYKDFEDEVRRVLFEWDSGIYREPVNKLRDLLDRMGTDDIKEFFYAYLNTYPEEFSTHDIYQIIEELMMMFLDPRILKDGQAKFVAKERAGYLKRYLEGRMYSSREIAEKYVGIQIENAEAILEACENKEAENHAK